MTYSLDLRRRVVDFVRFGGGTSEAARRFQVCGPCIYGWLNRPCLKPKVHGSRAGKGGHGCPEGLC